MSRWIPPLAGIALVFVLPVHAADAEPETTAYWPLKVGTKWSYTVQAAGNKQEMVQTVAKIEKVGGVMCARLESTIGGQAGPFEHIGVTKDGVARYGFGELKLDTPIMLLKLPPKKDDAWKIDAKVGSETLKGEFKNLGEEDVNVPAGKYKAIKVSGDFDVNGQKMTFVYFFAEKVGVVKQIIKGAQFEAISELDKVEFPK